MSVNVKTFLTKSIGRQIRSFNGGCKNDHDHRVSFDKDPEQWGGMYTCEVCGAEFEASVLTDKWDTPSGELEPGAMFWDDNHDENTFWDNHVGPHLLCSAS